MTSLTNTLQHFIKQCNVWIHSYYISAHIDDIIHANGMFAQEYPYSEYIDTPPYMMYPYRCTHTESHTGVLTQSHTQVYSHRVTHRCTHTESHTGVLTQSHTQVYSHRVTHRCTHTESHTGVLTQSHTQVYSHRVTHRCTYTQRHTIQEVH